MLDWSDHGLTAELARREVWRAAAQQMPEDGAIINVSSTCGQVGAAGLAAYCASKGAVNQLTRAMALELARAVFFLATERHVTGTILAIDGGYTAR